MYRARIALAVAIVIAALTGVSAWTIAAKIASATQASVDAEVIHAQQAFPKLELLRGLELTNVTSAMAHEDEFSQALSKTGDAQRNAAFVAVQARNARLEGKGRKADIIAVVGANGRVVCRDLNINAMYDEDLKAKLPALAKALEGLAVKDVWVWEQRLYNVGLAPIRSSTGTVAGVLLVGYAASSKDASDDKDRTGSEVAIFFDKKIQASSWKKSGGESTEEKSLGTQLFDGPKLAEQLGGGQMTKPVVVKIAGEDYVAAAGPLTGNLSQLPSAGYVVLKSLSAVRAPLAMLEWWVVLLGVFGVVGAVASAVLTALRFLTPLDAVERGVAEVINGNHDYQFEASSPDTEGLANGLNVMMARLLGRPDPNEDDLGGNGNGGGSGDELAVDSTSTGQHTTPENTALAQEPLETYLPRLFKEYVAARQKNGESTDGLTIESFTTKVKQTEAGLIGKFNCRAVRFKVVVKDGQTTLKPVPIS